LTQDITKNGSSEIAQSRDAKEIKKFLRQVPINLADSDWKQVDRFIDAAVENAERDTRERCAQIADDEAKKLERNTDKRPTAVELLTIGTTFRRVAERIRGKE
jgi:hypothetical protein